MENAPRQHAHSTGSARVSSTEIQEWLLNRLSEELRISRDKIRVDQPILSFGIDSVQLVSVVAQLEDRVGIRFSENPLEEYNTVEALSQFVADLSGKRP
jgi:acyl carrier protein